MSCIRMTVSKSIPKPILGLAGEYAVASEICRRGYYAQITFGMWKNVDVIAVNPKNEKVVLVEVKSKQDREWPKVIGFKGANMIQILVDYMGKDPLERPDFYIIDEVFWDKLIKKIGDRLKNLRVKGNRIIPVWPDGFEGVPLKLEDVHEYSERWDILENKLSCKSHRS